MKVEFACPSCGAGGSADAAFAGRRARCKHCGERFTIPSHAAELSEGYALGEPVGPAPVAPEGSTYVRARGDEATTQPRKPKRANRRSGGRAKRERDRPDFPWKTWLLGCAIAVTVACAGLALFAPRGTLIVGWVLLALGSVMVLVGYAAGAFGAFSEDFVYGVLYVAVPLYAGYYLLTRWDDLWPWFTSATAGFFLVLFGTELLRWNGMVP